MNRTIEKPTKDRDRQLKSLLIYFGMFLYENIEKGNIFYCFSSENERLEDDAVKALRMIKSFAVSKKKTIAR